MAWSLVAEDNWGLTARMAVEFRKPVEIGEPIRAEGWITRSRRRIVDTAARIVDAQTGQVRATATGVYVAADAARKQQLRERYAYVPLATGSQVSASPR
jgi:acyl-CoA thioesterase FadM